MTNKELAFYLRCTNEVYPKKMRQCDDTCPYIFIECCDDHPDITIPPDIVNDGKGYWIQCDCDRIYEDAAKRLEEVGK